MQWVGCTNELNAGYAADGYARVRGYGAVLTTYGVGELSAMNAIAGSFSEGVPVIHIVGAPKMEYCEDDFIIHHNFMNPDYFAFKRAYENVVEAAAFLNTRNAKEELERILTVFVQKKKPVYVAIPMDVTDFEIEENFLSFELKSNAKNFKDAVEFASTFINDSKSPVIIADSLIKKNFAVENFKNFVNNAKIPVTSFMMGKGALNESCPQYMGTYFGHLENISVYEKVNASDCVISVGTIYSDFNTMNFDYSFNPNNFIQVKGDCVIIQHQKFNDVYMPEFLDNLTPKIRQRNLELLKAKIDLSFECMPHDDLDYRYFLSKFQSFLKNDDMIFVDTGTLEFGAAMLELPDGAVLYNQFLWASIGWATPAVFGASMAERERRNILLTGEGAHQLTVQSLSNMTARKLKPVIFVLNNAGYTMERSISRNFYNRYNDITNWDYTKLKDVFPCCMYTAKVKTNKELDEVLEKIETENKDKMCYIELILKKEDLPELMQKFIKSVKETKKEDF